MTDARLVVRSAGPMVTIQDGGRIGHLRFGVSRSGPMDRFSHACSNAALNRPTTSRSVEISAGGFSVECVSGAITIALAGASPIVRIDDVRLAPWCVKTLHVGMCLSIRPGEWGNFSYLSFAGELESKSWLGSSATHLLSGFGGGALHDGDELLIRSAHVLPDREGDLPVADNTVADEFAYVVIGPQESYFTEQSLQSLSQDVFTLSPAFDRMGVRLNGPSLVLNDALSIPSEPVVRGSIQVSGDGVATVLLADHQTTGGYPKIATLVSVDTDQLAQLQAGQSIRFKALSPSEAISRVRLITTERNLYLKQISSGVGSFEHRLMQQNLIDGMTTGED